MAIIFKKSIFPFLFFVLAFSLSAQTKRTKKPQKIKKTAPVAAVSTSNTVETPVETPLKRNERPVEQVPSSEAGKTNTTNRSNPSALSVPLFFYEFTRPGFAYSRVLIEHDEAGKGKISFQKDGSDELITDPISLSPVTLAKINEALAALNFFESTESYQHARDFSHLGNVSIMVKRAGRERTVRFNWTENKHAKLLMDEYRRIGNEYIWRFEIMMARENFPLQTPGLMDTMDSYFKRSEISDPHRLISFLTELSTDERLPLMARNRADKLVKQIEKNKK